MPKILLVEDDGNIAAAVEENLSMEGYTVEIATNAADANLFLKQFSYDLILLDWNLPDGSGVDICQHFRQHGGTTPILMLTGKSHIDQKTTGFDAGADDYLTKPFHPRELLLRLTALLRRPRLNNLVSDKLTHHGIVIDTKTCRVTKHGEEIKFQPIEFELLLFFFRHANEVFNPTQLIQHCWDANASVSEESIYSCIRRLRKKLDSPNQPSIISTVHGLGYRLDSERV